MKTPEQEQWEKELAERQANHLANLHQFVPAWKPCMHDMCHMCHGTGVSVMGMCVHDLMCDCPKCAPTYTIQQP